MPAFPGIHDSNFDFTWVKGDLGVWGLKLWQIRVASPLEEKNTVKIHNEVWTPMFIWKKKGVATNFKFKSWQLPKKSQNLGK